jgi:CRP-like cAMP-binding protein
MTKQEQLDSLYPILNNISPISKNIWDDVNDCFKTKEIKKGEHLFRMGDKVYDFYFLGDGLARYYYLTTDGKEFNKSFAEKKGHLIGSIFASSKNTGSPYFVEALSDMIVLYISYKDFVNLGKKYPQWNDLLLRIYENLIIKKERREADFLLLDAQSRYEKFLAEYSMIVDVVPNYHIASYLGITEVALSRIRKQMNLT